MNQRNVKIVGLIIGILMFISVIAGFSYAYYIAAVQDTNTVKGAAACFDIEYNNGGNIVNGSVNLFDESSIINGDKITVKNGMQVASISFSMDSSCTVNGYVTLIMNVSNINNVFTSGGSGVGAFKYVLAEYSPSISTFTDKTFNIVSSGSVTSTGNITVLEKNLVNGTNYGYLVIFYVDGDMIEVLNKQGDNWHADFSAMITATVTQGSI